MTQPIFSFGEKVLIDNESEGLVCHVSEPDGDELPFYKVYVRHLGLVKVFYEDRLKKAE